MNNYQPHIKCKKGDIADIVLLPGDPGRIKDIIKYWDEATEIAQNREYLTYTGKYKGIPISACSTGVGCPGAAIAVEELANIGARIFIRIGTCGGLKKKISVGDLIIPIGAIRAEGTTKEYVDPEFPAIADIDLVNALIEAAKSQKNKYFTGINRTHDAFYEHIENLTRWARLYQDLRMKNWDIPIVSSEMECSVVFVIAMLRGLKAGAVLCVNTPEPLDDNLDKHASDVYELTNNKKAKNGIDKAIITALKAVEIIKKKRHF